MQIRPGTFRKLHSWLLAVATTVTGIVALGARADAFDGHERRAQTITITVTANNVTVAPATARAGEVTFRAVNRTSSIYDVDIDGPGPDGEIENIPANGTRTMTMTLRAGRYEIESDPQNGSRERETILTVRQ